MKPGDAHGAGTAEARLGGAPIARTTVVQEVWLVFALSLGRDAVEAAILFVSALTSGRTLPQQQAIVVGSLAPGRQWIDLMLQLVAVGSALVPVALVFHFLNRSGESIADIGLDRARRLADTVTGVVLAVLVGGAGLALYLVVRAAGADLTVVPETLPSVWWKIPVLLLSAIQNGVLEEILVVGYLLHRLRQLGWTDSKALTVSALLRASYHLYQGLGGFLGNAAMGVIFGRLYQRNGRLLPLVVAHTLMDATVFVGYALLAGHVSWIPLPR
ncbi:MAG: CPBP family intramembrane metalloprotease [Actinomycetota bacterium]|nr:CPBP family intramembrane metalloprotease [Actinomycetota bacterium]